jgi:phosphoglycerate dehydrogenase-like enzyme
VVAQTALAGLLALARHFPRLWAAQKEHRWASLIGGALPRDLSGQTAVVVGWGPVGQRLGALLRALGLKIVVARHTPASAAPGVETVTYDALTSVLGRADWLILACPLSDRTRKLVDARALAALPRGAHLVNVARGEIVVERDLIEALRCGALAGAYLDVFEHEPLDGASPLWDLDNVIVTPHSAGHSDGNTARVDRIFLANLQNHLEKRNLHETHRTAD